MKSKFIPPILTFCIILFLSGCVTRSYYISPMYGSSTSYRTLPLQKDSIKRSLYSNGAFTIGSTNEDFRDQVYSFQANIYNAHQFSFFKVWYGTGISLGNYQVHQYDRTNTLNPLFDTATVNSMAGNKFFGSLNLNGGFTIVIPLGNVGEFRIIGLNGSLQNEFGDYLDFRKKLKNDSIKINGLASKQILATIAVPSELVFKTHTGSFCLHWQWNILEGRDYRDVYYTTYPHEQSRYSYLSNTYALTVRNITGYMQTNIGARLMNFQLGVNYRINSAMKKGT